MKGSQKIRSPLPGGVRRGKRNDDDELWTIVEQSHKRWDEKRRHGNQDQTASKLIDVLRELGCHTTDITDALYEADPSWLNRLKDSRWYEDCAEDDSSA